jgi:hypothetical protein
MTGNQLYFNGPLVLNTNGGSGARIHAPATFALGSSCVHFNEATYPPGNANELMTPFSAAGDANHWPGPLCLAVMQDIGWTLAAGVGVPGLTMAAEPWAFPNPVIDVVHLAPLDGPPARLSVRDMQGRTIVHGVVGHDLDASGWPAGSYLVERRAGTLVQRAMVIKP